MRESETELLWKAGSKRSPNHKSKPHAARPIPQPVLSDTDTVTCPKCGLPVPKRDCISTWSAFTEFPAGNHPWHPKPHRMNRVRIIDSGKLIARNRVPEQVEAVMATANDSPHTILVAEDSSDDAFFLQRAFQDVCGKQ